MCIRIANFSSVFILLGIVGAHFLSTPHFLKLESNTLKIDESALAVWPSWAKESCCYADLRLNKTGYSISSHRLLNVDRWLTENMVSWTLNQSINNYYGLKCGACDFFLVDHTLSNLIQKTALLASYWNLNSWSTTKIPEWVTFIEFWSY